MCGRQGETRRDRRTVSQSVGSGRREAGEADGEETAPRGQRRKQPCTEEAGRARAAIFTAHDAATVRSRSIRHSKQSVRYVPSSSVQRGASGRGRSRSRHRRAATTTIGAAPRRAALRQPADGRTDRASEQANERRTDEHDEDDDDDDEAAR